LNMWKSFKVLSHQCDILSAKTEFYYFPLLTPSNLTAVIDILSQIGL